MLSVFKLRLPLGNGVSTMSMAYAVDFVALIIEGANLAMLLGAIGVLIQCTVRVRRKQPIHRAAFSAAAVIIAVQVAGMGWHALGGSLTHLTLTSTLLPLMVCAITYFIVNTSLVVGAIAVTSSVSPARAWNPEFCAARRPTSSRPWSPPWSRSPSPTACSSCCRSSRRRSMSATAAITGAGARWRRRCSIAPRRPQRP